MPQGTLAIRRGLVHTESMAPAGDDQASFRLYLDTSVFGGCFDSAYQLASRRLFRQVRAGRIIVLLSSVVLAELEGAPEAVKDVLRSLAPRHLEPVPLGDDVYALQERYLSARVLGRRHAFDALHVAAATVARADAIVSWNFRHIVRLDRMKAFNRVNFEAGYGQLTILSPQEVLPDER